MQENYFLGVDQSLTSTGVGLINTDLSDVQHTTIKPKKIIGAQRLHYIKNQLLNFIKGKNIVVASMEGYNYRGRGRVFELGEVGGLVKLLLFELAIPTLIIPPVILKKYVTSKVGASKEDMIISINKEFPSLGLTSKQDDAADAIGLATMSMGFILSHPSHLKRKCIIDLRESNTVLYKSLKKEGT